jgi:chemotaxis protein CheY-P-specific phosphatase CheC
MLQKYQTEILKTFWERCVSDALGALSQMIGKKIKQSKPTIRLESIKKIPKMMSPKEITTTLVYTIVEGELDCTIIFSSSLKHFLRLIDILLKKKIDYYDALNEDNEPIVIELGNIINGYFVSSLNNIFDTNFKYEESQISINPYRAIEEFNFGNVYMKKISVLLFNTKFSVEEEDIEGKLFLLVESDKIDLLLEAIGKRVTIK